jgi:hypothetical protein
MKKTVLLLVIWTASCNSPKPSIKESNMVDMLCDLQLSEQIAIKKDTNVLTQNMTYKALQNDVFQKYKVTSRDFDSSYVYYMGDMIRAQKIYDQVLIKLSEKQLKLQ